MSEKLPFYMAYQNQLPIDTAWERENSRDVSYMKSMYPAEVKKILPYVEAECDRLEYDVSMIYDEYPGSFANTDDMRSCLCKCERSDRLCR